MPGTHCQTAGCNASTKHTQISIFKIPKAKSGIPKHKNGENIKAAIIIAMLGQKTLH